jgi:hypothetical protein
LSALLLISGVSGCFVARQTVGDGPRGGAVTVHRSWYALWGFVALNGFDSRDVVGFAAHYRVTMRFGVSDVLLNLFTAPLGFYRQTTLVEK